MANSVFCCTIGSNPPFYAIFYPLQDLPDSEMIGEFGEQVEGEHAGLRPMVAPADAADQAGMALVHWVERSGEAAREFARLPSPNQKLV